MLQTTKRNTPGKAVGWEHLVIRPDTKLSKAEKRRLEKAIHRAKREGKIARYAQETIPYMEMYRNGLCRITEQLYSKSVLCEDMNYAEASDDERDVLFELYCRLINYFGPTVGLELSVVCTPADLEEYRRLLTILPEGDAFDPIREEYSEMLVRQVSKSRQERRICLTFTTEAKDRAQAEARLSQIESDVVANFRAMGVTATPMDGYSRLVLLHRCLHLTEPRALRFNWDSLAETGISSKDYIAPSSFTFPKDGRSFRAGNACGVVSFLQIMAQKLPETLLNELLSVDGSQIVTIHAKALDQGAALKMVKRKLSDLDKSKIDAQKQAVRSGYDMDILPPDLATFGQEAQKLLEALQNQDERMFLVTILLVHAAESRQKLENIVASAAGIANTRNCNVIRLDYQQEQGYMSALPIGVNLVEIQRGLTTSATAIFVPFRSCEVFQPQGGLYYGLDATTQRMVLADRKTLKCPNGIVLGTPGSGKSFFAKREIFNVFLTLPDDILIQDPENEYTAPVEKLGGQIIRIAPDSTDYLNPLDIDITAEGARSALLMKVDFIMSFCELILSIGGALQPVEKSIISRCTERIYEPYLQDPKPENMPVLGDLYQCLLAQAEPQAAELATALELYVSGSLKYMNHHTNVDIHNRVVCYNTSALGQSLKKPAMLTVQNHIWQRTTVNRYAGKTTRVFQDEAHLLLREPQTAAYTAEIYKRLRKWNGIPTLLTQNVKDLLASPEIENILENSDFVVMLNQAASDRRILAQRLGISPAQLKHVTNSAEGEGLLFFGDKIIPFVDKFPRNTQLYQVMTTKPSETITAA